MSLSQVQATVENTNDILESETAERMRLEEEIEKLKEEHEKLRTEHDHVQTELIEAKVEQPVQATAIAELGAELDLSLDGMFRLMYYHKNYGYAYDDGAKVRRAASPGEWSCCSTKHPD